MLVHHLEEHFTPDLGLDRFLFQTLRTLLVRVGIMTLSLMDMILLLSQHWGK
jgi:hypothetical protein